MTEREIKKFRLVMYIIGFGLTTLGSILKEFGKTLDGQWILGVGFGCLLAGIISYIILKVKGK